MPLRAKIFVLPFLREGYAKETTDAKSIRIYFVFGVLAFQSCAIPLCDWGVKKKYENTL